MEIKSLCRWEKLLSSVLSKIPRGTDQDERSTARAKCSRRSPPVDKARTAAATDEPSRSSSCRCFIERVLQSGHQCCRSRRPPEVPVPDALPFTFVDLFAGIGGFRIALKELGGKCAYSCEWDRYSQKTYKAWFGETPHGDIRQIKPKDIPEPRCFSRWFPCQPFSIAGVAKKKSLGRHTDSSVLRRAHCSSTSSP